MCWSEKLLLAHENAALEKLVATAKRSNAVRYTAYNHRFEPHFVRMKETIESGALGRIYLGADVLRQRHRTRCAQFAVARQGAGVLPDLGSHLLDTAMFWFGEI